MVEKKQMKYEVIFRESDADHNYLLSARELVPAFHKALGIQLGAFEVDLLANAMKRKWKRAEITKNELAGLVGA